MRGAPALALMVILALLAGCSGQAGEVTDDPSSQGSGETVASVSTTHTDSSPPTAPKISEERGGIRGVVVDQAIRPVANATVQLRPGDRHATTGADGQFVFDLLSPGTYFLESRATRFLVSQNSVVVEAGKSQSVRIVLEDDGTPSPRHVTEKFSGHADMDGGIAPDDLPLQCSECSFTIHPEPGFRTFVIEATGSSSTPRPPPPASDQALFKQIWWTFLDGPQTHGTGYNYTDFPFTSYVPGSKFENKTDAITLQISGNQWPDGQLDFDVYITTFYVDEAPAGWSILKGDE